MFDKLQYWKRRKATPKMRGQINIISKKFIPKGEKVEDFLNLSGSHLVKTNKGFKRVNRSDSRKRFKFRHGSKKNHLYQKRHFGFKHDVIKKEFKPLYPPGLSNHTRHVERKISKISKRKNDGQSKK